MKRSSSTDVVPGRRYRARHLLLLPCLLSLARVPLAFAFPWSVEHPAAALCVLVVAGLTDVLDGWYARRFDQATETGALVDPITDKLFVFVVVVTLMFEQQLGPADILMLGTRELGELPLVIWLTTHPRARRLRAEHPKANLPGKLATVFQFVSVAVVLFELQHVSVLLVCTAVVGAVAAVSYWCRELASLQTPAL